MRARVLPEAEWARVADRPPYDQAGLPPPDHHWLILVVEDDAGAIVASCALSDQVHWDGFHINPEARGNAAVFRAMLAFGLQELQAAGVPGAHLTIPDGQPGLEHMVERFGFFRAPGVLFCVPVPPKSSGGV
jgi:hypothetical protein